MTLISDLDSSLQGGWIAWKNPLSFMNEFISNIGGIDFSDLYAVRIWLDDKEFWISDS